MKYWVVQLRLPHGQGSAGSWLDESVVSGPTVDCTGYDTRDAAEKGALATKGLYGRYNMPPPRIVIVRAVDFADAFEQGAVQVGYASYTRDSLAQIAAKCPNGW